jgi:hypothetical protein
VSSSTNTTPEIPASSDCRAPPTTPTKFMHTAKMQSLYGVAPAQPPSPPWLRAKPARYDEVLIKAKIVN